MIIDIHTHTYPAAIAARAIEKLARETNIFNFSDGTFDSLSKSQAASGIDYSVLQPVATKASQVKVINEIAKATNDTLSQSHIMSFAAIHPDNDDYKEILRDAKNNGFKGIKLHPMFQLTQINDIRYLRIIEEAANLGLLVLIHGGGDINFPDLENASPVHMKNMLDELDCPDGIIVAHMGGWHCWEEAFDILNGYNIFLDTSSCLCPFLTYEGKMVTGKFRSPLSDSLFRSMVDAFGADHILFGSDSPWQGQKHSLDALYKTGLDYDEIRLIQGDNAAKLLGILS